MVYFGVPHEESQTGILKGIRKIYISDTLYTPRMQAPRGSLHSVYFSPPEPRRRLSVQSCESDYSLACCETLGMFFGPILPEIWISTTAIVLDNNEQGKKCGK